MIVYQSNKNWLKDVRHLYTSWTMQRVMRYSTYVMAFTAVVAAIEIHLFHFNGSGLNVTIFSLLGVVLSILLSFRTNTAYDRWWEGRKQWGDLVNNCRNLALYIHTSFPKEDIESRKFIANRINNFCIVLKEHLRNSIELKELVNVSDKELEVYSSKTHLPGFIAFEIISCVQKAFKDGAINGVDHINIKSHTMALMNITGACERIKKTPIPFSYNVYLKLFITIYALCLPFALIPLFGYWAVLLVGFLFFAFIGLELMAEEIEDPFGLDCNDLPTGNIAHTIRNNVLEIFELKNVEQAKQGELYSKVF